MACGIDAGVNALCLCFGEQLQQKVHLQQGLPAADSDAPLLAPVAPAAQGLFQQLVGGAAVGTGVVQIPGVRVVAEFTALGQPCKKITYRTPGPSTEPKLSKE